ncbi:flagellar hook assembly protein FlgD [Pelagibius sp. Alg239-R121]|uniref:flagellar hook assembly protein FlgD n=1 Tax=Pelagibius sp. Alg239-R121 TaxID=2993448 RepID=UPI0024A61B30|nr:flagellar hook capping FlgD N-terminal domain-containing protein [Pelagibius sp. Alg239-R121]
METTATRDPVNGVNYVDTSGGSTGIAGAQSLAETFDNFLVLLTEQLKNQDPLSPMESNEFTSQLVEFTGAEQAVLTNNKLDSLISLQNGNQLNSVVSYIGKTVTANSLALNLDESGEATIKYSLGANSETTEIRIIDADGNTVTTLDGETDGGSHEIVWDGKNAAGEEMKEGIYGFLVVAKDANGDVVKTTQGTKGKVTGVESDNGTLVLKLGELFIPLDQISSVEETKDATT